MLPRGAGFWTGDPRSMPPVGLSGMVGISAPLVQVLVAGVGQELDEVVVGGDAREEFCGLAELVVLVALLADDVFNLLELLVERLMEQLLGDLGAVVEDALGVVDPLPYLGPADLR